jgi:hypothetical protein
MTARATTWAIVSVNAAGPVNCARIDVPLVIQYIKSFHFSFHFSFFHVLKVFMGKNAGSHVLRASMVSLIIDRFPLIIFNYLLCSFFISFPSR